MPDMFLPCINAVDGSEADAAGGLLGDGDLTSNDGDASGWEAWNASANRPSDPGLDYFSYDVDASGLPAGATLTDYRLEMVLRLVPASPQDYPLVSVSQTWSDPFGALVTNFWSQTSADFTYGLVVGSSRPVPSGLATQLAGGTARMSMTASPRNLNVSPGLSAIRCTMAGLRVYYTLPAPAVTSAPPLRQYPRSDGLGTSSARRMWPPSRSYQRSNRRAGGYL